MRVAVVVPNWNGADFLQECLDSLLDQTYPLTVVVVENGSVDDSRAILQTYGDRVVTILHERNRGFSGGVNAGIRWALDRGYDAVALFNNDAVAEPGWLAALVDALEDVSTGITTSLITLSDGITIDTSGDQLSTWGLAQPRGRGRRVDSMGFDGPEYVFGACGGASLYRAQLFREIGLFDEDFFAYYEDVDLSFRAQLAGWKIVFTPAARVRHRLGATSSKIKGFGTYQMYKNMPLVLHKNVPPGLAPTMYPRFYLAYFSFQLYTLLTGEARSMLKGSLRSLALLPRKLKERRANLQRRTVSDDYIRSLLTTELPEGYTRLRALRAGWHRIRAVGARR